MRVKENKMIMTGLERARVFKIKHIDGIRDTFGFLNEVTKMSSIIKQQLNTFLIKKIV